MGGVGGWDHKRTDSGNQRNPWKPRSDVILSIHTVWKPASTCEQALFWGLAREGKSGAEDKRACYDHVVIVTSSSSGRRETLLAERWHIVNQLWLKTSTFLPNPLTHGGFSRSRARLHKRACSQASCVCSLWEHKPARTPQPAEAVKGGCIRRLWEQPQKPYALAGQFVSSFATFCFYCQKRQAVTGRTTCTAQKAKVLFK